MRRITFSRNYTISLSRTCQCYCKYCAFATHQAHIHSPAEVERLLDEAVKRRAKELLFLTGEKRNLERIVRKLGQYTEEVEAHSTLMLAGNDRTRHWTRVLPMTPPWGVAQQLRSLAEES